MKPVLKFSVWDKALIRFLCFFECGPFLYFATGMGQGSWAVIEARPKGAARVPVFDKSDARALTGSLFVCPIKLF